MRRVTLFAVALALVAGLAIAQSEMGRKSTAGANYTTGVVEQVDKSGISIREDSGQVVTFLFDPKTVGAQNYAVGSRVRVTWLQNERAQRVAEEVQGAEIAPPKVTPPPTVTYSDIPQPAAAPKPAPAPVEVTPPPPAPPTVLPKTATPLPALGLLGLGLLAGGFALRRSR